MSEPHRSETDHPLGLTVYDLPSPSEVLQSDARRTAMGRLRMLLVLLVCAAPVVASYFTYYVVRPDGRRNFGDLIEPSRALPAVLGLSLTGQSVSLPDLKGQWLLVSVAGGGCDEDCQRNLYLQRQLLTSLGKDRPRTEWVWLIDDQKEVPSALLPGLKEATVLRVDAQHLYVVDPYGQWMMRFPAKLSTEGALKAKRDMERLLRASVSWDEAGR
jgi:hypothetical protein